MRLWGPSYLSRPQVLRLLNVSPRGYNLPMAFDPEHLPDDVLAFLRERHVGTLTTLDSGGRMHVVAIAFTYEPADGLIRMITFGTSRKVKNLREGGEGARAAVAQVDGRRW